MLTLWGSTAETFHGDGNPVVSVKGAKVSDFSGVTLRENIEK
jgi:replication factor A1